MSGTRKGGAQDRIVRRSGTRTPRRGRPKSGTVVTWKRKNGDVGFGVRFHDQHGVRRYERCGLASEGWSRRRAELELENIETEVAAGTYVPSKGLSDPESSDPLFGAFGREVLAEHGVEIGANTRAFYFGLFDRQLAPFFGESPLSQITWSAIDRYKKERLRLVRRIEASTARGRVLRGSDNRPIRLSPRTINHSINLLSLILDEAVRRPGVALGANPARDRKLRAKVAKARLRDWLEPDEVMTLLEAAEDVDHPVGLETLRKAEEVRRLRDQDGLTVKAVAERLQMSEGGVCWLYERRRTPIASQRRAILATLTASGTRNTELCQLVWADLDFQHSKIRIAAAKTDRGVREIDMTPWLREQLLAYKASVGDVKPAEAVFPTRNGTTRDKDNLNRRVIAPVYRRATQRRAARKLPALPTRLSAHVFRRTYATLMAEAGAPPRYVQRQLGHGSARLTLEVYTRVSESQDRTRVGRAFDELMAGAVPPEADTPRNRLALSTVASLDSQVRATLG